MVCPVWGDNRGSSRRPEERDLGAALPRFHDVPTLLLWGERDWCFTTHFRDELAARLPHAERADLAEAGHYLFEDSPIGVQFALEKWLP